MADITHAGGRCMVISVNLNQGDLPLRIAFPILIKNILEQLSEQDRQLPVVVPAGSTTKIQLTEDRKRSLAHPYLLSPQGTRIDLVPQEIAWQVGPLLQCGYWKLMDGPATDDEGRTRREMSASVSALQVISCNMMNASESDLRPRSKLLTAPSGRLAFWGGRSIWMYLTLLGIVVWPLNGGSINGGSSHELGF